MRDELIRRAQAGDHEAFERLATEVYDRLVAIATRILRDFDKGEDAAQDTLVLAWRDLRGLREPDRFDAWIHRILIRACADMVRRDRRRPIEIDIDVSLLEIGPAVTDEATRLVDRDQIERGFRHLPVDQRAVLVLHHYVGLRPAEIAMTLGIPIGTVNSRIHYGTRTLRAALEADLRPIGAPSAERIS